MIALKDIPTFDGRFFGNTGSVIFISICDFADAVFGKKHCDNPDYNYQKVRDAITEFINENPQVHYYSEPRENFFLSNAQDETLKLNKHYCIVEDLS